MASTRRKVLLLGSTGSIGTSALKVAQDIPDWMEIVGLAAQRSVDCLVEQVRATGVKQVALTDPSAAAAARAVLPNDVTLHVGPQGLVDLVRASDADMVLIAIVGVAGLSLRTWKPFSSAIFAGGKCTWFGVTMAMKSMR